MKILHISSSDSGGAGLAALRLHRALFEEGVDSKMLVAQKTSDLDSVYLATPSTMNSYVPPKNSIRRKIEKILRRRGKCLSRIEKYDDFLKKLRIDEPVFYTYPVSRYDLANHPLVQDADIIHLHWVQNFLDFETFFSAVNKPIIWTFHDLNPLYGGFHHFRKKEKFYEQYRLIEEEFYAIKRDAVLNYPNLSIVSISSEMDQLISGHEFYKEKRIFHIHNSVNAKEFKLFDRGVVRQFLGLPVNKKIFLFVNSSLEDSEKGLPELCQALRELKIPDSAFLCVGDGMLPSADGLEVVRFHPVADMQWLSMIYNAADLLVFPSKQESFGQTPLEALCCGTPVVMTPTGIATDAISDFNGVICDDFSVESLKKGILKAMSKTYDRDLIRENIIERFNPSRIAKEYISAYETILKVDDNQ